MWNKITTIIPLFLLNTVFHFISSKKSKKLI